MQQNIVREVEALDRMSVPELREKYHEVFGEEARSTHKDFLRKRIAWRIQANAEGGLSERARRMVGEYVEHYNHVRLHGAIGYIAPADKLAGREEEIWAARDRRLEAARAERKRRREAAGLNADRGVDNRLAAAVV
jgi:hypothetical protein